MTILFQRRLVEALYWTRDDFVSKEVSWGPALDTVYTADTVYTVDMVYTYDMDYTVDMVYTVDSFDMVYTVYTIYLCIQKCS